MKERTTLKTGTAEDWNKAVNFIPLKNEPILYSDSGKMKLGDGKTSVKDLPFFNERKSYVEDEILNL